MKVWQGALVIYLTAWVGMAIWALRLETRQQHARDVRDAQFYRDVQVWQAKETQERKGWQGEVNAALARLQAQVNVQQEGLEALRTQGRTLWSFLYETAPTEARQWWNMQQRLNALEAVQEAMP